MAEKGGFKQHHTTIYHPASNGLCENTNKQAMSILRGLVEEISCWDRHLGTAQLALNSAYHSSLGDTPYYCCMGTDPIIPHAAFTNLSPRYNVDERAYFTYTIFNRVKENLEKAATDRERRRASVAKSTTLTPLQRVYVRTQKKKGDHKFSPKWRGPYRVIRPVEGHKYLLEEVDTGKKVTMHLENMKVTPESVISTHEAPDARQIYRKRLPEVEDVDVDRGTDQSSPQDQPDRRRSPRRCPGPSTAPMLDDASDDEDRVEEDTETPHRGGTAGCSDDDDQVMEVPPNDDVVVTPGTPDAIIPTPPTQFSPTPTTPECATNPNELSLSEVDGSVSGGNERRASGDEEEPNQHEPASVPDRRVTRSREYGEGFYKDLARGKIAPR